MVGQQEDDTPCSAADMSIFLSYNSRDFLTSRDESFPRKLQFEIEKRFGNKCVFLDESSLRAGGDWRSQIQDALNRASILVLLAGPRFFEDDQMRRLAQPDSVIKHELLTARNSANCSVIPVSVGSNPPHKSGQSWPSELAWLSDIQWVHLNDEYQETNTEILLRCIRDALVAEKLRMLRKSRTLTTDVSVLCDSSPVVLRAVSDGLSDPTMDLKEFRQRSLRGLIKSLTDFDSGSYEDARLGTKDFAYVRPEVRAILLLRNMGRHSGHDHVSTLRELDGILRPLRGRQDPDWFLRHFILLNVQRGREILERIDLSVPQQLGEFHVKLRALEPHSRDEMKRIFSWLVSVGICVSPDDRSPFCGKGNMKNLAFRPKSSPGPMSGGKIIPRSRAPRPLRGSHPRRGKGRK